MNMQFYNKERENGSLGSEADSIIGALMQRKVKKKLVYDVEISLYAVM